MLSEYEVYIWSSRTLLLLVTMDARGKHNETNFNYAIFIFFIVIMETHSFTVSFCTDMIITILTFSFVDFRPHLLCGLRTGLRSARTFQGCHRRTQTRLQRVTR